MGEVRMIAASVKRERLAHSTRRNKPSVRSIACDEREVEQLRWPFPSVHCEMEIKR